MKTMKTCPGCNGDETQECPKCEGTGQASPDQYAAGGVGECAKCKGTGEVNCPVCKGNGEI